MTASIDFLGSGFSLESLTQVNASTFRLVFTDDPQLVSRTSSTDALNPGNYVLTGPGANAVQNVSAVNGSNQAVDLYCAQVLVPGTWTLSVANVQTISSTILQAPTALSVTVSSIPLTTPLGQGAQSPSSYDALRRFFNPALKGPNWTALLQGLAAGDDIVKTTAIQAFDQLFRSTASAPYLDDLAADYGDQRPNTLGLSDDLFRKLSIVGSAYKTLESTLEAVLEIFYGSTATRASATSSLPAPWNLRTGDQLVFDVDGRQTVAITFNAQDFSQIGQATGVEAAVAVTRGFLAVNSRAYALPSIDPRTGSTYLQVFSPSLGLDGSVTCLGGRAQNVFGFPTEVETTQAPGTQWTVTTTGLAPGTARFTWTAGTDPTLALVQVGDVALVYGPGFSSRNQGNWPVIAVTTTYFDAALLGAVPEVVTTTLASDLTFLSPDKQTINDTQRPAFAVTTDDLEIVLPTTTEIVTRGPGLAAYLHGNPELDIVSGTRDVNGILTVAVGSPHGLIPGDPVWLQDLEAADNTAPVPQWDPPSGFGVALHSDAASCRFPDGRVLVAGGGSDSTSAFLFDPVTSTWAIAGPMITGRAACSAVVLADGRALVAGNDDGSTTCEIYDPVSSTWTSTGSLNTTRNAASMVFLASINKALIMGGATDSVEFYDPVSASWTQVDAVLSTHRQGGAAVVLRDGRVLSIGGNTGGGVTGNIDLYTPANNSWTSPVATLATPRSSFAAVVTSTGTSGNVVITGGSDSGSVDLASTEILNPATWALTAGPTLVSAVTGFDCDTLLDGRIVVAGGNHGGTPQSSLQIMDLIDGIVTSGPDSSSSYHLGTGTTLLDGRFLQTGTTTSELFSPYLGTAASGALNGGFRVLTVPDVDTITVQQALHAVTTLLPRGTLSSGVPVDNGVPGPFVYDPSTGVAITGTQTQTTTEVVAGQSYRTLGVLNTTGFPATGWLALDFGYDHQVSPVKYLAVLSATQILLDPTYRFPVTLEPGTAVNYVTQNFPWIPPDPEIVGSFYVTTTAAGRIAAESQITALIAGGLEYSVRIEYPEDRGLGNAGYPVEGSAKLSDNVRVYGGDDLDQEIPDLESE